MPVEFACPECQRGYRVKDELTGKTAKCGKCGHRMRIPALEAAAAAPVKASAAPTASPRSVAKTPQAKAPQPKAPPARTSASWLDEELESAQPKAASAPRSTSKSCPACGAALAAGAVLCVSCGYDTRTHAKHETKHVDLGAETTSGAKKRFKLAGAASLLRGTLFSFIAAILGAAIWTAIAAATGKEFSLVAWGLGGLVGLGMALGHDDDDGTFAGIIAAFMSLVGIVAAKAFIIIFVIAPALAALFAEMEAGEFGDAAQVQAAAAQDGEADEQPADDLNEAPAVAAADADDEDALEFGDEEPGLVRLLFASMFSPVDGIFILLAFFTAYGVGSGQMTD
jgi:predicted Zn finger-like uncharacterized protein